MLYWKILKKFIIFLLKLMNRSYKYIISVDFNIFYIVGKTLSMGLAFLQCALFTPCLYGGIVVFCLDEVHL